MSEATAPMPRSGLHLITLALAAPVGLWVVLFLLVPPARQDFPAGDSWCYARGALAFYRGEGPQYYQWASPAQLGQWLWAAPFIALLGQTHVALTCSTRVLALIGGLAFYALLRLEGRFAPGRAAFATTLLLLNPLYFVLAGTFMTDVPALAMSLAALALYAWGLREGGTAPLLAGMAAATLAAATRQNTITVPLAAAFVAWRLGAWRRPAVILAVGWPVLVWIGVILWMKSRPDTIDLPPERPGPGILLAKVWAAGIHLGLATLPVLVLTQARKGWRPALTFAIGLAGILLAIALSVHRNGYEIQGLPFVGDNLTARGAFDTGGLVENGRPPRLAPLWLLALVPLAGCVAAAALANRLLVLPWRTRLGESLPVFTLLHVAVLLVTPTHFDRYLLSLMPGALYLALAAAQPAELAAPVPWSRLRTGIGLSLLAGYGLFALALTYNWLAWNSARWELGRRALARGVNVLDLEGGFEWDGWNVPGPVQGRNEVPTDRRGFLVYDNPLGYPQLTGRYGLAFAEHPPHRTLDSEPYTLWLPPGQHRLYLLEYVADGSGD